jgi:hypothetical protein
LLAAASVDYDFSLFDTRLGEVCVRGVGGVRGERSGRSKSGERETDEWRRDESEGMRRRRECEERGSRG